MGLIWKFRILVLIVLLPTAGISLPNLLAELTRPTPLPSLSAAVGGPAQSQATSAELASTIMPFRSDLKADYALRLAGRALRERAGQSERASAAQDAVRSALGAGPHDSQMWLVLALLQARTNVEDPRIAESLKMSYLTGQNRPELIQTRLQGATSNNFLNDPDLRELARGDVRAILTQLPEQRQALVSDYAHASEVGKAFLEESAGMVDPKFIPAFRSAK
jgi:hypothetical protein